MTFIENLTSPDGDRFFYFAVVLTTIISIVLHELAHGVAAIWQGDDTPVRAGHMTLNPVKHMGVVSLLGVLLAGIGWGAMPVNPAKFRSRYGDAWVSLAGPAMNVLLAILALTALVIVPASQSGNMRDNLREFLWIFGYFNIVLALFNLAPVPPLDGSRVLSAFSPAFRRFLYEHHAHQQTAFWVFFIAMMWLNNTDYSLWHLAANLSFRYLHLLHSVGL